MFLYALKASSHQHSFVFAINFAVGASWFPLSEEGWLLRKVISSCTMRNLPNSSQKHKTWLRIEKSLVLYSFRRFSFFFRSLKSMHELKTGRGVKVGMHFVLCSSKAILSYLEKYGFRLSNTGPVMDSRKPKPKQCPALRSLQGRVSVSHESSRKSHTFVSVKFRCVSNTVEPTKNRRVPRCQMR